MHKLTFAAAVTGSLLLLGAAGCNHHEKTAEYRTTDNTPATYGSPMTESNTPSGESATPPAYQNHNAQHPLQHPLEATSHAGWQVIDASGNVIGHVADAAGTVVDDTGKVIGRVGKDGANVVTETGETIGKIIEPGHQP